MTSVPAGGAAASLEIRRLPITHADAASLVEAVQQEYVVRYGGRDETPLDIAEFAAPLGAFYVGYVDGEAVASGAWRKRRDVLIFNSVAVAEVKRMNVAEHVRGQGLARAMLAHLEETAREAGAEVMILETGSAQPEAMQLYETSGYEPIPPFGHYRDSPMNRCYARRLAGSP